MDNVSKLNKEHPTIILYMGEFECWDCIVHGSKVETELKSNFQMSGVLPNVNFLPVFSIKIVKKYGDMNCDLM